MDVLIIPTTTKNQTNNSVNSSQKGAPINWMIKCDDKWGSNYSTKERC